ncbi:MAG TPA: VOC family protein [Roseiarcus sp.]|nr:VOC family protein [Roseiarcus sp.]
MLDHVTLRTKNLEGAKAFFETVLGLEVGYRPAFAFPGYWLYADGRPIVHLIPGQGGPVDRAGETIDHVAFRLNDHEGMRRKLDRLSIPYSQMDLPELLHSHAHRHPPGTGLPQKERRIRRIHKPGAGSCRIDQCVLHGGSAS